MSEQDPRPDTATAAAAQTRTRNDSAASAQHYPQPLLPRNLRNWMMVWYRNYMVWKKLAIPSMIGNLADPMIYLFGLGFGNATSLPPLIAQVEFVKDDVTRAVALVVGMAQAAYAFAPATFGLIRAFAPKLVDTPGAASYVFVIAALLQGLAIAAFLAGRRRQKQ